MTANIRPMTFLQYSSLAGSAALARSAHKGCSWFASTDRRVAGHIVLIPDSELWHPVFRRHVNGRWLEQTADGFESYDDAEKALLHALQEALGPPVTVREVVRRLRFGKKSTTKKVSLKVQSGISTEPAPRQPR